MPIHQNLLQRLVDSEEVAIRWGQSASLLARQHVSQAPLQAAPALLSHPCPRFPDSWFLCSSAGWALGNHGWGLAASRLRALLPTACQHHTTGAALALGTLRPHRSGTACQISVPTGEEFEKAPKPNKIQVCSGLPFSCKPKLLTQLGNMLQLPPKKPDRAEVQETWVNSKGHLYPIEYRFRLIVSKLWKYNSIRL